MELIDYVYLGFFWVMIFSSTLWLLVFLINRNEILSDPNYDYFPSVTFIVPAYNEEKFVERCIDSLIDLEYPNDKVEIIAVNDGSTDSTLDKLMQYEEKIRIIDKENTGKANSINEALKSVDTDLVGCMDADSFPDVDFLKNAVQPFKKDSVKGVTPSIKVSRSRNWIEKVQWTEYIFQVFLRKLFAIFGTQYVLPGPGSLYRTSYLKDLGGWNEETVTEDMEIAFRIHYEGGRIENTTRAVVETVPPKTLKELFIQRKRWYTGYIENLVKYFDMFGNKRYGNLGVFLLPFNAVWLLLVIFFFARLFLIILEYIYNLISSYLVTGSLMLDFGLLFQSMNVFHVFLIYFTMIAIGTILVSLKVAGEDVKAWSRKFEYILFLLIYPSLFAMFWIFAGINVIKRGGRRRW